ncbi:MAG: hypothetical protein II929_02475 [Succinivibrio sp.]|nr:hypothetical protein [Succinivibrio sp.]
MLSFEKIMNNTVGVFGAQQEYFEDACREHDELKKQLESQSEIEQQKGIGLLFEEVGGYMRQAIAQIDSELRTK